MWMEDKQRVYRPCRLTRANARVPTTRKNAEKKGAEERKKERKTKKERKEKNKRKKEENKQNMRQYLLRGRGL